VRGEIRAKNPRAAVGGDENDSTAFVGSTSDLMAGVGRVGIDERRLPLIPSIVARIPSPTVPPRNGVPGCLPVLDGREIKRTGTQPSDGVYGDVHGDVLSQ
jgi:hypothetical protein